MRIIDRARAWFALAWSGLRHEFSEPTPRPIDAVFAELYAGATRASRDMALSVPAMLRARNLICATATLPLLQYDTDNRPVPHPMLVQIDPDVPNVVTLAETLEDLLFEGIAWWRIVDQDTAGYPTAARRLDPRTVSLQPPAGRTLAPLPSGEESSGTVWVDGRETPSAVLIRFDSPNPGVLKAAGRSIGRAVRLDKTADMYAENPRPLDYFSPTEGADPADDEEVKTILGQWASWRRKRATGYVPAALTYNSVDTPTPADLQLVDLQKRAALDIANATGLDAEELGISTTSRTYANDVDRRRNKINDTLKPYMRAITDRLSMRDVVRPGREVRFDLDEYLAPDPMTRATYYQRGLEDGWMIKSEVRAKERLVPIAGIDDQPDAEPEPSNVVPIRRTASDGRTAVALDSGPLTFMEPTRHGFTVDRERRRIRGLVLPYGDVAQKFWRKYRFAPGALQYVDMGRVKLLRDHDYAQALGRMVDVVETPEGVVAEYSVATGAEGDRALALAAEGVLDGLSVGVDFDPAADTVPDPNSRGVTLVRRADWRETSLTAMPSFDRARVTSVAASRIEGNPMEHCSSCGGALQMGVAHVCTPAAPVAPAAPAVQPAAPAAPFVAFDPERFAAFAAWMQAGGQHAQQPGAPAAPALGVPAAPALGVPADPPRQTVNAARPSGAIVVEPPSYTFDRRGNLRPGKHDFSTDLFAFLKNPVYDDDGVPVSAAGRRVAEFIREQFDVITTDVNELNPTGNRPQMYVDQREYRYPVWESINKGSLQDITPFTFPKFSSSSGLVGNHTEGVEPSSGTLVTTSGTVTPTAVSGKAKITREVWDQGGNPQVSGLVWRQMVRGWYEALEARAVAVLDAATPTAIALTAGGGTTGQTLSAELEAAIAALQFIRGGFRFDATATQIDLFKALAAAKDDDKRPLYPLLGPANANGGVDTRFSRLNVAGVDFLPAWALAASGSVVASSYLYDREAVHGWATEPRRLNITETEVAHVYIGLWGYAATVISDITGVREITYDPVA